MVITSKGAAGITGAGLVTLTASLQAFGGEFFSAESIAVGIALVVGIDRIMSEGRALTNCIGNGVATMVVAGWQGERDDERFQEVLRNPSMVDARDGGAMRGDGRRRGRGERAGRFERERGRRVASARAAPCASARARARGARARRCRRPRGGRRRRRAAAISAASAAASSGSTRWGAMTAATSRVVSG